MQQKRYLLIPYNDHLHFTKWLIAERDSLSEANTATLQSINTSIIVTSCMILEGFLHTFLKDSLFLEQHRLGPKYSIEEIDHPPLFKKLLIEYGNKLDEDSWRGYIELFELFTDCKIDRSLEMWKSIDALFSYRNFLIHGNEFELNRTGSSMSDYKLVSPNRKLNNIFRFLKERDLINVDMEKVEVNLLSSKAADHFYESMKEFAVYIFDLVPQDKRFSTSTDMTQFRS